MRFEIAVSRMTSTRSSQRVGEIRAVIKNIGNEKAETAASMSQGDEIMFRGFVRAAHLEGWGNDARSVDSTAHLARAAPATVGTRGERLTKVTYSRKVTMAKRNDTSKNRLSSNPAVLTGSPAVQDEKESHRRTLYELIEAERTRLSQAQSLLECLNLALEYRDDSDASNPTQQIYYPDIVEMIREIVRESVNRLDSLYIRPLVEAI